MKIFTTIFQIIKITSNTTPSHPYLTIPFCPPPHPHPSVTTYSSLTPLLTTPSFPYTTFTSLSHTPPSFLPTFMHPFLLTSTSLTSTSHLSPSFHFCLIYLRPHSLPLFPLNCLSPSFSFSTHLSLTHVPLFAIV